MKKKTISIPTDTLHRRVIPFAQAVLWGTGVAIATYGFLFDSFKDKGKEFIYLYAIATAYIIFLLECMLVFIDLSYEHEKQPFSGKVWLVNGKITLNFILTAIAGFCYHIFQLDGLLALLIVTMASLKFKIASLPVNIETYYYRVPTEVKSNPLHIK